MGCSDAPFAPLTVIRDGARRENGRNERSFIFLECSSALFSFLSNKKIPEIDVNVQLKGNNDLLGHL